MHLLTNITYVNHSNETRKCIQLYLQNFQFIFEYFEIDCHHMEQPCSRYRQNQKQVFIKYLQLKVATCSFFHYQNYFTNQHKKCIFTSLILVFEQKQEYKSSFQISEHGKHSSQNTQDCVVFKIIVESWSFSSKRTKEIHVRSSDRCSDYHFEG